MDPPSESDDWDPPQLAQTEVYVASVSAEADGSVTCTISPLPKSERALRSEWVAASEGSFVPLAEMR